MAHSRPAALWTRADARRCTAAAGAFTVALAVEDQDVEVYYQQWYAAHVALQGTVPRLVPIDAQSSVRAAIADFHRGTLETTRHFVRTVLGIPEAWVGPVAGWLTDLFRVRTYNRRHPGDRRMFGIPIEHQMPEQGKMPAHDAADITRNAQWVYRARFKRPPDSKHELARVAGCGRSVVQNGLKQGWALIDLAARRGVLIVPEKVGPPS